MEEKRTRFVESSNSDTKKLIWNAAPKVQKKSTKFAFNSLDENYWKGYKLIKTLLACWYVGW